MIKLEKQEIIDEIIKLAKGIANETNAWVNEDGSINLGKNTFNQIQFYVELLEKV